MSDKFLDITPSPKILRTLGEIPFEEWQCLAELIDNSIDAFSKAESSGTLIAKPTIDILWSNNDVPTQEKEITIIDNGPGMSLEVLQNAAKAGYSSNDPIHNLGLFGMGFNIATARLGDTTKLLSTIKGSKEWIGIEINFNELIKKQNFSAQIITEPKEDPSISGTKIIISNLKEGIISALKNKESSIRKRLQIIYTPILNNDKVSISIKGKRLSPRNLCIWGKSRYVIRKGEKIFAYTPIDRDLGECLFDIERNRYLAPEESFKFEKNDELPKNIIRRSRRLKGWLGIQRFSDTTDFGIDFIRNGRKILVGDKSFFSYENSETGTQVSEYPVELGSTIGGRIVGELYVDYLIPSYQKNGFDVSDKSWVLTREAIRGIGPILPKKRSAAGYEGENKSPLSILVNAYRRVDAGTRNLAAPNSQAKSFAKFFYNNDNDYLSDDKWFRAAQESDRLNGEGTNYTPVNNGEIPSDELSKYTSDDSNQEITTLKANTEPDKNEKINSDNNLLNETSSRDLLIQHSEKIETLSQKYSYNLTIPGIDVVVWKSNISIYLNGERVPYYSYNDGVDMDFFYDITHPILNDYPITPKQLLILALAERFSVRDQNNISIHSAYWGLIENHLSDEKINPLSLQEKANSILDSIRERLPALLGHRFSEVRDIIKQVQADEEFLINELVVNAHNLVTHYRSIDSESHLVLSYVSNNTIKRLIANMPEEFLDDKAFNMPYHSLNGLGDENMVARIQENTVEKVTTYISDLISLVSANNRNVTKQELIRFSNTIDILDKFLIS